MFRIFLLFLFLTNNILSQTIQKCKFRFEKYLNYKNTLNNRVIFEKNVIYLLDDKGNKETAIYENEIALLADFFTNSDFKEQRHFIKQKGLKNLSKQQFDSIKVKGVNKRKLSKKDKNLKLAGYRIAIDPGHSAANLTDAKIEQKFLYFVKDSVNSPNDTIKLFESVLTFNTALLVKKMLEEEGAKVLITRNQDNYNSFNCNYNYWLKYHKHRVLDSLKKSDIISVHEHKRLIKLKDRDLFWEFFRDFDLNNRAKIMNDFFPHASLVIHYNVDEKNNPWKQTTKKNYTMAFIGGAFTRDNLTNYENKIHFLRLLLTDQLDKSEKLASSTVNLFNKYLNIPIASQHHADYLAEKCLNTTSSGVFSRNLNMCRLINSPLVYGESLYQDHETECVELMKMDLNYKGVKTNNRLLNVAKSYSQAVTNFLLQE